MPTTTTAKNVDYIVVGGLCLFAVDVLEVAVGAKDSGRRVPAGSIIQAAHHRTGAVAGEESHSGIKRTQKEAKLKVLRLNDFASGIFLP